MTVELPIDRATLDNGLRVVLQPDRRLPLVAINLWYHVGSRNERPGRTGFAHLFEHMLFQGSEHVGTNDHFRHVQQAGGVANGSTWFDRTNYYETLPAHRLDLGLWLESDRMGFLLPAMTPEKLETQRQVVMNERRQRVDNQPYGRAFERLHELLYPSGHPYRWPVIGYMEDIAAATLEDVRDFFRTYYVPANAVLTLVGDFQPAPALEQVERFFGPLPGGRRAAAPDGRIGPLAADVRETLPDDVQLARAYLGFRVPPFGEPGWYAADLLATALTSGKSSLLYHDLVYRRELAQDVSAFVFPTALAATFGVVATARPGVAPAELERALLDRLEESAARPLPDIHLERARNQTQTTYFEQLQVLDQRADLLSLFTTFFDDPGRIEEEPARYLSLDSSDLQRCAAGFLRPEQRATVTVVPRRASP